MPLSSANARWEKTIIAGAKTTAATPSLRRCEMGRLLFVEADAILAVMLCPVSSVSPPKTTRRYRNPETEGAHDEKFNQDLICQKKISTATEEPQSLQQRYGQGSQNVPHGVRGYHRLAKRNVLACSKRQVFRPTKYAVCANGSVSPAPQVHLIPQAEQNNSLTFSISLKLTRDRRREFQCLPLPHLCPLGTFERRS